MAKDIIHLTQGWFIEDDQNGNISISVKGMEERVFSSEEIEFLQTLLPKKSPEVVMKELRRNMLFKRKVMPPEKCVCDECPHAKSSRIPTADSFEVQFEWSCEKAERKIALEIDGKILTKHPRWCPLTTDLYFGETLSMKEMKRVERSYGEAMLITLVHPSKMTSSFSLRTKTIGSVFLKMENLFDETDWVNIFEKMKLPVVEVRKTDDSNELVGMAFGGKWLHGSSSMIFAIEGEVPEPALMDMSEKQLTAFFDALRKRAERDDDPNLLALQEILDYIEYLRMRLDTPDMYG